MSGKMLIFRALNNKTVSKITHPTHASQKYKKNVICHH